MQRFVVVRRSVRDPDRVKESDPAIGVDRDGRIAELTRSNGSA